MGQPRTLALRLFTLILAQLFLAPPSAQAQQPANSNPNGQVLLTVTVTDDNGHYASGLARESFLLIEGKAPRDITYFEEGDAPLSVAFLVDMSNSMTAKRIAAAKLAVARFIQQSRAGNEYFIGEVNSRARMVADWTSDPVELAQGFRRIGEAGASRNTALYDACSFGLDSLARARHAKRVLFIITDGQDNASHTTLKELRRKVGETDVLIYALGLIERGNPDSMHFSAQVILDELALLSGGRAFFPDMEREVAGAAERFAAELRHQYVIGFVSDAGGAEQSKLRKVKVKVTGADKRLKGLNVRAREAYLPRAAR